MSKPYTILAFALVFILLGAGCSKSTAVNTNYFENPDGSVNDYFRNGPPTTTYASSVTVATSAAASLTAPSAPKAGNTAVAPISYVEALRVYRTSGFYFQFVNCSSNPGSLTVKSGSKLMLDNRDSVSRRIKVGSTAYTLAKYGYKIVYAPKTVGLHYITCDGGGSGQLTVQK